MKRQHTLMALFGSTLLLTACGGSGGGGGNPDPDPVGNGCPAGFDTFDFLSCQGNVYTVSGDIDQDLTMDSGRDWRLDGVVRVGGGFVAVDNDSDVAAIKAAGVTLTIEPGTDIRGLDDGILIVTRGSQIMANGTAANPITFSSLDNNFDGLGEWGGVVIQGFAPHFGTGNTGVCSGSGAGTVCNVEGEGGSDVESSLFGGNLPADNSGVMRYVRIAEGGLVAGPNNEVNGLTLQGVGHGTTLEYIQVHNNLDDAFEWFGGTVNARYIVATGNDDDDIDFDEGWMGNIQFAIAQKSQTKASPTGSNDPRGIEANSGNEDFVPQTQGALANVTVVGGPLVNAPNTERPGLLLRGAVTASIYNAAVRGFDTACVQIQDADTDGTPGADAFSSITLVNVIGDCADGYYAGSRMADDDVNAGPQPFSLDEAYAINEVAGRLASAPVINAVANGSSFTFEQTDYIGAVEPGTDPGQAWWAGWTIPGSLIPESGQQVPAAADFVNCNVDNTVCTISSDIDQSYTLLNNVEWRLDGVVRVGGGFVQVNNDEDVTAIQAAGVTLTVQPGTHVKALDDGILIVTRGSRIVADGTRNAPITFSSLDDGFNGLGEWGGVVIQGFAPHFGTGDTGACFGDGTVCNVEGEGGSDVETSRFGGNIPDDDSGILRYVRIAEGGLVAGPNNEVNGLTMQGVGHGTEISFVQVHNNLDDAFEWFGGTVNARYIVATGNDDDDIDFDEGWRGNVQYALAVKSQDKPSPTGSNDPRGVEANSGNEDYVPQTNGALANITVVGGPLVNSPNTERPGLLLRGAVTASIYNSSVQGFDTACVQIQDADTDGSGSPDVFGAITLINVLGNCADGYYSGARVADQDDNAGPLMFSLDSALALDATSGSLASPVAIPAVANGSGFTFDATDYIGAVEPGTAVGDAWWSGWTIPGSLDLN